MDSLFLITFGMNRITSSVCMSLRKRLGFVL